MRFFFFEKKKKKKKREIIEEITWKEKNFFHLLGIEFFSNPQTLYKIRP